MLKANAQAPLKISVLDEDGQPISLSDTIGQYVVLYFYPRDNTPGCTTEACEFRDSNQELEKLGARVVGASKDSIKSHEGFKQKHQLNFELWSDPDHKLMEAFGAWGEKSTFGKKYQGVIRSTFIIDPQGKIIKVWPAVKPVGHAQQVLKFLKPIIAK